jgi:N-acetylneuraminic acid mutarotase
MRRILIALVATLSVVGCAPEAKAPAEDEAVPAAGRAAVVWSDAAPLPRPSQEIYPTAAGGALIVAGGFGPASGGAPTALAETWVYERGLWTQGPPISAPRHHMITAARSGEGGPEVIAIGGYLADEEATWKMQADVWLLNAARTSWSAGPSLPTPRSEGAIGVIGDTVVLAAGRRPIGTATGERNHHTDAPETLLLAPGDDAWGSGAPIPTPRNSCAGAVLDGRLHVIGGRSMQEGDETGFTQANTDVHEAYDLTTDTWTTLAPLPKAAAGIAGATFEGKIYIFGGEEDHEPFVVWTDVWVYDPATDSWEAGEALRTPRHGHGVVTLSDGLHIVGGSELMGGSGTTGLHEVYSPRGSP